MQYATYNFVSPNFYAFSECNSKEIINIGNFLFYDLNKDPERFARWVKDPCTISCSSNITILEKDEKNILIGNLYPINHNVSFALPQAIFIDILEKWESLLSLQVPKIMIIAENNSLVIQMETQEGIMNQFLFYPLNN